jgi:preprotein translocase subunit YajC
MPEAAATPTALGSLMQFVPIIVIFGAMFWMMSSSQRKEKKKKEALLNSLKKGQKVQTVGGILGTVEEVRESEVVVLVDVRNKVNLTFRKDSISSVID